MRQTFTNAFQRNMVLDQNIVTLSHQLSRVQFSGFQTEFTGFPFPLGPVFARRTVRGHGPQKEIRACDHVATVEFHYEKIGNH